jgi:hypothetical protein
VTGYFIDLTAPQKRALVASDSLAYTVTGDHHRPLGFASKTIPFAHLRGALIGSGLYEVQLGTAAALMRRPELISFDDVVEALPAILAAETEMVADHRGVEDAGALMLAAIGWVGWNDEAGKFELVTFENYKDDYTPQRGASGLIGIPNVPPSYVPPGFTQIADPVVRAMAGLRAIGKFTRDEGREFGMPPLGGEIVVTDLRPDGIVTKLVGRLDGFEKLGEEIAATWNTVLGGNEDYSGLDLVNRTADREQALRKFEAIARRTASVEQPSATRSVTGLSRQQRRAAEKEAEKLARKAARAERVA